LKEGVVLKEMMRAFGGDGGSGCGGFDLF
jgi:hypothetical protein